MLPPLPDTQIRWITSISGRIYGLKDEFPHLYRLSNAKNGQV
jgi:hypothetical protein